MRAGSNLGEAGAAAVPAMFQWGGFLQQSGYTTGQLIGGNIQFARMVYYNKLVRQTFLEGVYAGFSLEAGRVGDPLVPGTLAGLLKSGAAFLGLDSPAIGPLYPRLWPRGRRQLCLLPVPGQAARDYLEDTRRTLRANPTKM